MGMSCGFSSFELGIGGIGYMTSSRDCAWLIAPLKFDESFFADCSSICGAEVVPLSCLTDKIA